jgi:hypothetical protein
VLKLRFWAKEQTCVCHNEGCAGVYKAAKAIMGQ